MPITAKAQGKTFTFPDGTTPEDMGAAIDEFFSQQVPQPVQEQPVSIDAGGDLPIIPQEAMQADLSIASPTARATAVQRRREARTGGVRQPQPDQPQEPRQEFDIKKEIGGVIDGLTALGIGGPLKGFMQAGATVEGIGREMMTGDFFSTDPKVKAESTKRIIDTITQRVSGVDESIPILAPQTERGQKMVEAVGQFGEAFAPLATMTPMLGPVQAGTQAARAATPPVTMPKVKVRLDNLKPSSLRKAELGFKKNDLSVGAAKTPEELERAATSRMLPVPFKGESKLTEGQVKRDFEILQFEKETAKRADIGLPLRERLENQAETLIQNFDALSEQAQPMLKDYREVGLFIDESLKSRLSKLKRKENKLYAEARAAGEMAEDVTLNELTDSFNDISRFSGVAPNANAIINEAKRLKIVDDELNALPTSLDDYELFRQFINQSTDLSNPPQSRVRRIVIDTIDDGLLDKGGELYQVARKHSSNVKREFENVGLTKRLLSTKPGTEDRAIALEDVFKKIYVDSPIDDINKLRGTLLKSGDEGKQAWADIKSLGIDYIKDKALSYSQTDSRGNPVLSTEALNRTISQLDQKGKLASLYGKKNAQVIRDLGDIAKVINTAPPGAVNFSNTASALQVALDSLATFGVTGVPAPVVSVLQEASKFVKNKKLKERINQSLNYLNEDSK